MQNENNNQINSSSIQSTNRKSEDISSDEQMNSKKEINDGDMRMKKR